MHYNNRTSSKLILLFVLTLSSFQIAAQAKKPLETFEAFWKLFNERYASFEEKGIDWQSAHETFRPQIHHQMTNEELFEVLHQMIQPLNDEHTNIIAKNIGRKASAGRPSRILAELEPLQGKKKPYIKNMTASTLYAHGFDSLMELGPKFRGERLFSFSTNGRIGYLRLFRSFSTLLWMRGPSMHRQLDQLFSEFNKVEALILDIRFNIGGTDEFSQKLAGMFIEEKMIGFRKQSRKEGAFGELTSKYIHPTNSTPFLKPVILLTNDQTVSAADVFTMMMDQLPNVTIMGERTNGSYSDLFSRKLPNGWRVTLSNQRYYTVDMKNYEGFGNPVDIEALTTLEDVQTAHDSVLVKALQKLRNELN